MTKESTELTEKKARKRVKELKDYYGHLAVYLLVNSFLMALNLLTSPGDLWFLYPLLGWGIGLASHTFAVFGVPGVNDRAWEERKVRELMAAERDVVTVDELERRLRQSAEARKTDLDVDRLIRRIEHLEAIVTSRNWDLLEMPPAPSPERLEEQGEPERSPTQKAAELARRVR